MILSWSRARPITRYRSSNPITTGTPRDIILCWSIALSSPRHLPVGTPPRPAMPCGSICFTRDKPSSASLLRAEKANRLAAGPSPSRRPPRPSWIFLDTGLTATLFVLWCGNLKAAVMLTPTHRIGSSVARKKSSKVTTIFGHNKLWIPTLLSTRSRSPSAKKSRSSRFPPRLGRAAAFAQSSAKCGSNPWPPPSRPKPLSLYPPTRLRQGYGLVFGLSAVLRRAEGHVARPLVQTRSPYTLQRDSSDRICCRCLPRRRRPAVCSRS